MAQSNKTTLWLLCIAICSIFLIFIVLPYFARARVSSWTTGDAKLANCTNANLKILIKQMPERGGIKLVLGTPQELTNAVVQISGLIRTSGGLTLSGATSITFAITATNHATSPSIIMNPDELLLAYFLVPIEGALTRSRPGAIDVMFSNTVPPEVSLWARYRYDRYHPVHVK